MSPVLGFYAPEEENGYLSNWYPCTFRYGRYTYSSAEQFMMAQKAWIFGDYMAHSKIMETSDQAKIKRLGRGVKNYDDAVWERLRGAIMRRGLRAKFQQNSELLEKLFATGNAVLAECAPRDKVWGIGLSADDGRVQDPAQWKGRNLLGNVLMEVRSDLRCWSAAAQGNVEYEDATDLLPNEIWEMPFPLAKRLPKVKEAVDIYGEVVKLRVKDPLCPWDEYCGTMAGVEDSMRFNMGGGLPVAWFYEMKQEIYDLVRFRFV